MAESRYAILPPGPAAGAALDSPAINRALDACREHGGVVRLSAGAYRCGGLRLRDNDWLPARPGVDAVRVW